MVHAKSLSSSAFGLGTQSVQHIPVRVRACTPCKPFAAAQQQRRMGWAWPFNAQRRKDESSASNLQQLLDAATSFSREPSAEALQHVKAALCESSVKSLTQT